MAGQIYTTGENYYGQLGDGFRIDRFSPVSIARYGSYVAICVGEIHTVALDSDGMVWTWGNNYNGQLGNNESGYSVYRSSPVSIARAGTYTAITAGTYSISINLNSGSLLVGLGDAHVDFFYAVDLNDSQIQTTYQNTVFFDAQSSDPAQTLTIQFLQTVAVGDTLKVYQAASVYTASGSNSMQSGLVSKSTGTTGMGVVPSAAIYIHKV